MKMNMSYLLLICISLYLIKDCTTSNSPDAKHKIIGRWIWLQSSGGWTGGTITPESVGYEMTVVFEQNGKYNEFKNDSLILNSTYEIIYEEFGSNNEKKEKLKIDGKPFEQFVDFEDSNKLILIENCYDCYTHKYLKTIS